ncbi:S8 family serine peptidase [Silvanigrella aquatica]|uniref:Peptidase S8/S53 domain-containing protein n=1 Tax=Silvanigrella aquatica TaxID=1915309 RepID=A0A1L4CY86_9BACT|nr:S8 family serine peptidase [Silvanigrella aquatica]APJ02897.1 hypothetical protein AXG55_02750 [Silvanigrella aquatica]
MKEFINFIYKNSGNKINRLKIFFIFNLFINLTFINTGCGQKNTDSNDLIGMKINSINRSNHTSLSQNSNSSENIFKEQWYLKNTGEYEFSISTPKKGIDLNIPFEKKYTGKGVNVLILDTGIDFSHPDLKENILENSSFFFSPEKDIPEIVSSHILATNENHHGTNVAGIIGAKKNSQTQFQGIAPEAKLASANIISNNLKR